MLTGEVLSYFEVRNAVGGEVRFASLSNDEAVRHAQQIYRSERHVCDLFEVPHEPVDHRRARRAH